MHQSIQWIRIKVCLLKKIVNTTAALVPQFVGYSVLSETLWKPNGENHDIRPNNYNYTTLSEMQKKAYNSEIVRYTAKDKCTAASKASSNFANEQYRQSFRSKRRGVSPSPILWWASRLLYSYHE